jgi:hypothetical protein
LVKDFSTDYFFLMDEPGHSGNYQGGGHSNVGSQGDNNPNVNLQAGNYTSIGIRATGNPYIGSQSGDYPNVEFPGNPNVGSQSNQTVGYQGNPTMGYQGNQTVGYQGYADVNHQGYANVDFQGASNQTVGYQGTGNQAIYYTVRSPFYQYYAYYNENYMTNPPIAHVRAMEEVRQIALNGSKEERLSLAMAVKYSILSKPAGLLQI